MGHIGRCRGISLTTRRKADTVQDLVSRLSLDNLAVNNGVLQVAHTIFKRWRPLYRSDALFTEINHVLGKFGEPFLAQLQVRSGSPTIALQETSLTPVLGCRYTYSPEQIEQGDTRTAFCYSQSAPETPVRPFCPRSTTNLRRKLCRHSLAAAQIYILP